MSSDIYFKIRSKILNIPKLFVSLQVKRKGSTCYALVNVSSVTTENLSNPNQARRMFCFFDTHFVCCFGYRDYWSPAGRRRPLSGRCVKSKEVFVCSAAGRAQKAIYSWQDYFYYNVRGFVLCHFHL